MPQTINYSKVKSDTGSGKVPVATILPWTKATPPIGYLKCDGSAVSRIDFEDLFSVIGTTYGSGDGSTTFNLPDLTSRTLVGANTSTNVGQTGGAHDTTGAGLNITNNLTAQNSQNLAASSASNLSAQVTQNLGATTTQNLSTPTASNLTTQVTQNLGASTTQNLGFSVSGNINNHTLSLSQITSHSHPRASGNANRAANQPESPNINTAGNLSNVGNSGGNQAHNHGHNFSGGISGSVATNITGNVAVNIGGSVDNTVTGGVTPQLSGGVSVNFPGNVDTNITGNVVTNITGDVNLSSSSIYEPHLVTIYIIKF